MCRNYSREVTIQGWKLYEEIQYNIGNSIIQRMPISDMKFKGKEIKILCEIQA